MAGNKKKEDKAYTYPEILEKYFPNVEETQLEDEEFVLTIDNFYDILTKITQPKPAAPKKVKG